MHQRTARAAVWTQLDDEPQSTAVAGRDSGPAQEKTIWAKVPYQSRLGRCLAVRRRGDTLLVAIAGSPTIRWLPAKQVLSDEEAARWVATGF